MWRNRGAQQRSGSSRSRMPKRWTSRQQQKLSWSRKWQRLLQRYVPFYVNHLPAICYRVVAVGGCWSLHPGVAVSISVSGASLWVVGIRTVRGRGGDSTMIFKLHIAADQGLQIECWRLGFWQCAATTCRSVGLPGKPFCRRSVLT